MAVDQKKLDKLNSSQTVPGGELGDLTEIQGQLGAINAERENNLAQERIESQSIQQNNTNLRTAVEIGTDESGNIIQHVPQALPPSAAGLRPETQALLSNYGIQPNITENNSKNVKTNVSKSSTSNSGRTQSGAPVTNTTNISNVTTTNNTSETKIEIENKSPQVAQPTPIPIAQNNGGNQAKFKTWLNNLFASQNERYEVQKKEYNKREWSLRRESEKLTKKLGDVTKSVANKLDPANMGRTVGSQMKVFALLIGGFLLAKFWNPLRKWLQDFQNDFKVAFGLPGANNYGSRDKSFLGKLNDKIGSFFGAKDGENAITAIGKTITEGLDRLWNDIKDFFAERADAVRSLIGKDSKIDSSDWGLLGNQLKGPIKTIGNLLAALVGGSEGLANSNAVKSINDSRSKSVEKEEGSFGMYTTDLMDQKKLYEDTSFIKGKSGNILSRDASIVASNMILRYDNEKTNILNPSKIAAVANELYKSNKETYTPVTKDLLTKFYGLTEEQISKLIESGLAREIPEYRQKRFKRKHAFGFFNEPGTLPEGALNSNIHKGKDFERTDDEVIKGKFIELSPGAFSAIERLYNITTNFDTAKDLFTLEKTLMKHKVDNLRMDANKLVSGISDSVGNPFKKSKEYQDRYDWRHDPSNPEYHHINTFNKNSSDLINNGWTLVSGKFTNVLDYFRDVKPERITEAQSLENAKVAMKTFIDKLGLTKEQAAGVTGVLMHESGLNPKIYNESERNAGKKGYGIGIAQWSNERKAQFEKDTGKKIEDSSLQEQLDYIVMELQERRRAALRAIKNSNSIEEATDAFLRGYENGGENALASPEQINSVPGYAGEFINGRTPYENMMINRVSKAKAVLNNYSSPTTDSLPSEVEEYTVRSKGTLVSVNPEFSPVIDSEIMSRNYSRPQSPSSYNVNKVNVRTSRETPSTPNKDSDKNIDYTINLKELSTKIDTTNKLLAISISKPIPGGNITVNNNKTNVSAGKDGTFGANVI